MINSYDEYVKAKNDSNDLFWKIQFEDYGDCEINQSWYNTLNNDIAEYEAANPGIRDQYEQMLFDEFRAAKKKKQHDDPERLKLRRRQRIW